MKERVELRVTKIRLMVSSILVVLTLVAGLFVVLGEATAADPEQAKGNVDAGRLKFSQTCTGCHLNNGLSAGRAPVLAGKAREESFIRNQVRNGGTRMPPFGPDKVSDTDLDNLVAYVQSLASAAPVPAPTTATASGGAAQATTAAATTAAATTTARPTTAAGQGGGSAPAVPAAGQGGAADDEVNILWIVLPLALLVLASAGIIVSRTRKSSR